MDDILDALAEQNITALRLVVAMGDVKTLLDNVPMGGSQISNEGIAQLGALYKEYQRIRYLVPVVTGNGRLSGNGQKLELIATELQHLARSLKEKIGHLN